jgi:hypothetical protein
MKKPSQNGALTPDYLTARKLHLNEIIVVMADMKTLNVKANTGSKVETLTIEAIKAELDFIDLQLKKRAGDEGANA